MDYPLWLIPGLGGGMVIAIISIVHVFFSHFAVGMGFFVVMAEGKAYREGNEGLLRFVRQNSFVLLVISTILGALTGVGIWFSIGLVHPAATSTLLRTFVWGWAMEWVFFFLEIVAVLLYYYTWDRVSRSCHLMIGWIYFIGAFASMVLITAIVAFMLTPGKWLETRSFWNGMLNPTFFPSVVLRSGICLGLACLGALAIGTLTRDEEKRKALLRYSGLWLLPTAVLLLVGGAWWAAKVPEANRALFLGETPLMTVFFLLAVVFAVLALGFSILSSLLRPGRFSFLFCVLLLILFFFAIGAYEMVREGCRKPFVITGYMYSNGIRVEEVEEINEKGFLATKGKWLLHDTGAGNAGEALYNGQCRMCHEMDGYNALRPLVRGWKVEDIEDLLGKLNIVKGIMPPFVGTQQERALLASWLQQVTNAEKGEDEK